MNRRNFVLTTSMGAFALTLPSLYGCESIPDYPESLAEPQDLSYIMDENTILTLGDLYRKERPDESSEGILVNSLMNQVYGASSMEEELNKKITEEFRGKETILLAGWIIATTEAQQCALYSIKKA